MRVTLSEVTSIRQTTGMRSKSASPEDLIPGLRVRVNGQFETAGIFVAHKVPFSKKDFRIAERIKGGVLCFSHWIRAAEPGLSMQRADAVTSVLEQSGCAAGE